MTNYVNHRAGPDGWSIWIRPLDDRYRLACCDCGLVHNMQFRIDDEAQINFRVERNNRATAQLRRHRTYPSTSR